MKPKKVFVDKNSPQSYIYHQNSIETFKQNVAPDIYIKGLFNTIMMDSERDISWDKLVTTEPTTRHLPVKNLLGARKLCKNDAHHQIY